MAYKAFGTDTKLYCANDAVGCEETADDELGTITSLSYGGGEVTQIDTTAFGSSGRKSYFPSSTFDEGELSVTVQYQTGATELGELAQTDIAASNLRTYKIEIFADSDGDGSRDDVIDTYDFCAYVKSIDFSPSITELVSADIVLKITND